MRSSLLRSVAIAIVTFWCALPVASFSWGTCPSEISAGDRDTLKRHIDWIRLTPNNERRADLLEEFDYCIGLRGLDVLRDSKLVLSLADLLDGPTVAEIVTSANLLGDLGSAAQPALPKLKKVLSRIPEPVSPYGFRFNRQRAAKDALEHAIAKIEKASD